MTPLLLSLASKFLVLNSLGLLCPLEILHFEPFRKAPYLYSCRAGCFFVKHALKVKHYIRYADDFVIFSEDVKLLENIIPEITVFLKNHLSLNIHENKVFVKTLASGVDFLGWVHFFNHRLLRTVTKKRMFKRLDGKNMQSYLGLLNHGDSYKIREKIFDFKGK